MSNTNQKTASASSDSPGVQHGSNPFKRTLTVPDMVVYGLICMVPIAPMAIYGDVFQTSNGMPALAYIIGFIAVLFSVLSFGMMIAKFPSSGSIYTYASHSINKAAGFITGWLMLLQYLTTPALMYIIAGTALHGLYPEIDVWVWCLIFWAIVSAISLRGMKTTVLVDRVALVAELVVLALFFIFGFKYMAEHPDAHATATALFDPSKFNMGDTMAAVSLAVLSYVGFGCIATLTQEAKNETKGPPRAMMIMALILVTLFALQCYVATCIDPSGSNFKSDADNGFYVVAKMITSPWLSVACAVMVALSQGVFTALAGQTSVSLILFSMARSGSLPKKLGKLKKGTNLPIVANMFVLLLSLALIFIFIFLKLGMSDVAKISNFGAVATYGILNVCVIAYFWIKMKDRGHVVKHLIFPALGAAICFYILGSLNKIALIVGAIWIAVGIIYYCIRKYGMHKDVKADDLDMFKDKEYGDNQTGKDAAANSTGS